MNKDELQEIDDLMSSLSQNFDYYNMEINLIQDETVQDYFGENFRNEVFLVGTKQDVEKEKFDLEVRVYVDKSFNLYVNPYEDVLEDANNYTAIWRQLYFEASSKLY